MTIEVTRHYVVDADQTLTFTGESAFDLAAGDSRKSPDLLNYGSIEVGGSADEQSLIAISADAPGKNAAFTNAANAVLTISTSGAGSDATAVDFTTAGSVDNSGEIQSASAQGSAYGVVAHDAMDFSNDGLVNVQGRQGGAAVEFDGGGQVVNDSQIIFSAKGIDGSYGVEFVAAGSFENNGLIQVHGGDNAFPVTFGSTISHFVNSGSITATTAQDEGFSMAVSQAVATADGQKSELTNSGLVRGEFAFHLTDPDGVVLHNSGSAIGFSVFSDGDDQVFNTGSMSSVSLGAGDDLLDDSAARLSHGDAFTVADGGNGTDTLIGSRHDDQFAGGNGNDTLVGGRGADTLIGGHGADDLTGGKGADTFVFQTIEDSHVSTPDVVRDFGASDRIDLSPIDTDGSAGGDQPFTLVDHLDGHAGEAALISDPGDHLTRLVLDLDGDGRADSEIDILGRHVDPSQLVL